MASIVRIPYANQLLENKEYLYNFTDFGIWSSVEIGLALSASSLGTLRPLLRKINVLAYTDNPVPTHFSPISRPSGSNGRLHNFRMRVLGAGDDPRGTPKGSSVRSTVSVPQNTYRGGLQRGGEMAFVELESGSERGLNLANRT